MNTPRNIFLVGPMGAGKSTAGRHLAKSLNKTFFDSDVEIERTTGVSISLIFELEGESGFRQRERVIINQLTQRTNIILATGGGAVLDQDNRTHLATRGFIVYLHAPIDLLVKRTSQEKKRPLLQNVNPKQKLEMIMREREPLYRKIADIVITTNDRNTRYVTQDIVRTIEEL